MWSYTTWNDAEGKCVGWIVTNEKYEPVCYVKDFELLKVIVSLPELVTKAREMLKKLGAFVSIEKVWPELKTLVDNTVLFPKKE